jgi:hypothetical protein
VTAGTDNVGAMSMMFKTANQTISASSYQTVTWEATTNALMTTRNDLSMADLANDRFVFTTAGTGTYTVALSGYLGPMEATKVLVARMRFFNGSTTNSVANVAIRSTVAAEDAAFSLTALLNVTSTAAYVFADVYQSDSDAGAEYYYNYPQSNFMITKQR